MPKHFAMDNHFWFQLIGAISKKSLQTYFFISDKMFGVCHIKITI